ncbi:MAG: helix-turn-helix domain-containing protein [Verrucomicrobiota bacterium]
MTSHFSNSFWGDRIFPQLNTLWRGSWRPGQVEPARLLYDHELVLLTKGFCTVQINDQYFELHEGDYIIIPPNTYHATYTKKGVYRNCIHFDWLEYRQKKLNPLYCYYPEKPSHSLIYSTPSFLPKNLFRGSFKSHSSIPPLIHTLFHRWQANDQVSRALARSTFLEIILLLMTSSQERIINRNSIEHAYKVRDVIEQRGESHEGIQSILKSLGFSYPHLCRLFKSSFGITPVEYRNAIRLERAKKLLLESKKNITEIAYEVGFDDPGYFSRQFKKQNKISPKNLRSRSDLTY